MGPGANKIDRHLIGQGDFVQSDKFLPVMDDRKIVRWPADPKRCVFGHRFVFFEDDAGGLQVAKERSGHRRAAGAWRSCSPHFHTSPAPSVRTTSPEASFSRNCSGVTVGARAWAARWFFCNGFKTSLKETPLIDFSPAGSISLTYTSSPSLN